MRFAANTAELRHFVGIFFTFVEKNVSHSKQILHLRKTALFKTKDENVGNSVKIMPSRVLSTAQTEKATFHVCFLQIRAKTQE